MNLSDATEVATFLKLMQIDPEKFADNMAALEWTIKRRHQIVHPADIAGKDQGPSPFDKETMIAFFDGQDAILDFATKVWPLVVWEFDPTLAPVPAGMASINRIHGQLLAESKARRDAYLKNPRTFA